MSRPHPLTPALLRRRLLALGLGGLGSLSPLAAAWGRQPPPRASSPLVGVDPLLVDTGLTRRWQSAMHRDLGWAAQWSPMPSGQVLEELEQGTVDAGLFFSSARADALDHDGLIYNRQTLARTEVILIGPREDVAGIRGETDPTRALTQVLAAAGAGAVSWDAPAPDSALAALLTELTRGSAMHALPPAEARKPASDAHYRLVTNAQWLAHRPAGTWRVWLQGQPRMQLAVQVACSFRAHHGGARLLVKWLQAPLAQRAFDTPRGAWLASRSR
jgi:hypothetical protein